MIDTFDLDDLDCTVAGIMVHNNKVLISMTDVSIRQLLDKITSSSDGLQILTEYLHLQAAPYDNDDWPTPEET